MKKVYKKMFLIVVILTALFMGTVLAFYPSWEHHREHERQEAVLGRIEQTAENALQPDFTGAVLFMNDAALIVEKTLNAALLEISTDTETDITAEISDAPETDIIQELSDATETEIFENTMPGQGDEIGILTIPKIDAYLPVTAGATAEQLKFSEGWVMQTAEIGSKGNAVIAGHRSYTYGQHFNRLGELESGDEILYTSSYGVEMCFTVSEILTVLPDSPAVFDEPPEGTAQLTLYTCTPVRKATYRLIVRALLAED